jgi:hypothetical protein
MITSELEKLILLGKARHLTLSCISGSFLNLVIDPAKVLVIYSVDIFPHYDIDENSRYQSCLFTMVLNSKMSRDVIPYKLPEFRPASLQSNPYPPMVKQHFDLYSLHREILTIEIRKAPHISTWVVTPNVVGRNGYGTSPVPIGNANLVEPQTIEIIPGVGYQTTIYKAEDPATYVAGANVRKFEIPCDVSTQLTGLVNAGQSDFDHVPVYMLNCVLTDSGNYDKIKTT